MLLDADDLWLYFNKLGKDIRSVAHLIRLHLKLPIEENIKKKRNGLSRTLETQLLIRHDLGQGQHHICTAKETLNSLFDRFMCIFFFAVVALPH